MDEQQGKTVTTIETKPSAPPAPKGSVDTKVTVTRTDPLVVFGRWGAGLIGGFIRGGAHAITSGTAIQVLDPAGMQAAITRYGVLFVLHGIVSTAMYLQAHPIPPEWDPSQGDRRGDHKGDNK